MSPVGESEFKELYELFLQLPVIYNNFKIKILQIHILKSFENLFWSPQIGLVNLSSLRHTFPPKFFLIAFN